jgi:hypothetical protein
MATEVEYRIWWVTPDGRSREAGVTLTHESGLRALRLVSAAAVPSPLGLVGLVAALRPANLLEEGLAATYPEALSWALREFAPALFTVQMLAVVLALWCYRRQLRYGARPLERLVWPLFVLVLGLPGWVGYRFGRSWPVLDTCLSCGAKAPRDRRGCSRCDEEFPLPAFKGTEVFA